MSVKNLSPVAQLLLATAFALSPRVYGEVMGDMSPEMRMELSAKEHLEPSKPSWKIEFGFELHDKVDQRHGRPQHRSETSLLEAHLALQGLWSDSWRGKLELSIESFEGASELYIKEAWLRWEELDYLDIQVGQFLKPIGWFGPREHWFLHRPSYYESLLPGDKGLDIGLHIRGRPLGASILQMDAACFRGQVFRQGDGQFKAPEREPCVYSLGSSGAYHNIYASFLNQHLAYREPLLAYGLGVDVRTPAWGEAKLLAGWVGEHWWLFENQTEGGDLQTRGWMSYPYMEVWRVRAGFRWGETQRHMAFMTRGKVETAVREQVVQLEVRMHDTIRLIYEDFRQVSRSLLLEDERALRLVFLSSVSF